MRAVIGKNLDDPGQGRGRSDGRGTGLTLRSSLLGLVAAHQLAATVPQAFAKAGADELKLLLEYRPLVCSQLLEQHGEVGRNIGHGVGGRREKPRCVLAEGVQRQVLVASAGVRAEGRRRRRLRQVT
jgi:hypothetical protein